MTEPRLRLLGGREPLPVSLRTADGLELAGDRWTARRPADTTVVLVHGFAGSKDDPAVVRTARALTADGYDVVTYDARGHGASPGRCTLGDTERHDVEAALRWAGSRTDRVVVVGASMGAIAVLRQAAEHPELDGVVTVSGPSTWRVPRNPRTILATAMTQTRAGRHLARRHLGVEIDPVWSGAAPPLELVGALSSPLAVVHGRRDRFIPLRDAQELYRAAADPCRLLVVDDMAHGYDGPGVDALREAVRWTLARSEDRAA